MITTVVSDARIVRKGIFQKQWVIEVTKLEINSKEYSTIVDGKKEFAKKRLWKTLYPIRDHNIITDRIATSLLIKALLDKAVVSDIHSLMEEEVPVLLSIRNRPGLTMKPLKDDGDFVEAKVVKDDDGQFAAGSEYSFEKAQIEVVRTSSIKDAIPLDDMPSDFFFRSQYISSALEEIKNYPRL